MSQFLGRLFAYLSHVALTNFDSFDKNAQKLQCLLLGTEYPRLILCILGPGSVIRQFFNSHFLSGEIDSLETQLWALNAYVIVCCVCVLCVCTRVVMYICGICVHVHIYV
jgi:hypothetical protein